MLRKERRKGYTKPKIRVASSSQSSSGRIDIIAPAYDGRTNAAFFQQAWKALCDHPSFRAGIWSLKRLYRPPFEAEWYWYAKPLIDFCEQWDIPDAEPWVGYLVEHWKDPSKEAPVPPRFHFPYALGPWYLKIEEKLLDQRLNTIKRKAVLTLRKGASMTEAMKAAREAILYLGGGYSKRGRPTITPEQQNVLRQYFAESGNPKHGKINAMLKGAVEALRKNSGTVSLSAVRSYYQSWINTKS